MRQRWAIFTPPGCQLLVLFRVVFVFVGLLSGEVPKEQSGDVPASSWQLALGANSRAEWLEELHRLTNASPGQTGGVFLSPGFV